MFFVGQTNMKIMVDSGVDITGSTVQLVFTRPSGSSFKKTAQIDSAQEGLVSWTGSVGDDIFDESGSWSMHMEIAYADGTKNFTRAKRFHVSKPGTI